MNDNKYYTPSLEEFHAGFRYQGYSITIVNYKNDMIHDWEDRVFKKDHKIYAGNDILIPDNTRVKRLDREDIEELGWKINSDQYYFKPKGIGEQYFLEKVKEDVWSITYEDHTGEKEEVEQLFLGKINNYNEFKTVMGWVGIK